MLPKFIHDIDAIHRKKVLYWLIIGIILVFVQVLIGGITRLTNSGLSITEWNIIKGTLPPLNEAEWVIAFEKYKAFATKQFQSLHADMDLSSFKKIYFWEYFHRLWARSMGFIFLFPFLFFVFKKWISTDIIKRLAMVILLAALAATFGWIMVASGLNEDNRTWVSAYKLVIHLLIATSLLGYLTWTTFIVYRVRTEIAIQNNQLNNIINWLLWATVLQISLGGLMAGMRAGLVFPQLSILSDPMRFIALIQGNMNTDSLINYESNVSIKAWVQLMHRATAYFVLSISVYYYFQAKKFNHFSFAKQLLMIIILLQVLLGIMTVINCIGAVPALWGALHQGTALLFMMVVLWNKYGIVKTKS